MAKGVTKGDMYELRLARMLYAEGAFVRRGINLNMRFGEDLTVTDLDIYALSFSGDLESSLTIAEAKSAAGKKGPKLADRLLWLSGLRELVGADVAIVSTAKGASDRLRGLAEKLDIAVIDEQDLRHRESINGLDDEAPWGPYDPRLLAQQREIYDSVKLDKDLKRVYWFLRSESWLLDPTTAIKRAFGAVRVLVRMWDSQLDPARRSSLQWLARHLQVSVVVGLVQLASRSYREDPKRSSGRLLRELAAGPTLDYEAMSEISRQVDRYVTTVLRDMEADPGKQVGALGAFSPTPPPYAEPLLEVIERLAAEPNAAAELPRLVDRRLAAIELGEDLEGLGIRESLVPECDRLLRLVGAFVVGQIKAPPELLDNVLGESRHSRSRPDPSTESDSARRISSEAEKDSAADSERLFDEATRPAEQIG